MMIARVLLLGALIIVGCDKAQEPYKNCQQLEAAGKMDDAIAACEAAVSADSTSPSGKMASAKLDEIVPTTVSMGWCTRLRAHLESRLASDARVKYGGAGGDVGGMIHDNVLNVESNCHEAVGQPTAGLWTCRWNETLDTYPQCDSMAKSKHR